MFSFSNQLVKCNAFVSGVATIIFYDNVYNNVIRRKLQAQKKDGYDNPSLRESETAVNTALSDAPKSSGVCSRVQRRVPAH